MDTAKKVMIIGHKNPDTDSICSAIGLAEIKNKLGDGNTYVPMRAGNISSETQFVLDHFGIKAPELLEDIGTQVKNMEVHDFAGVSADLSIKAAWDLMQKYVSHNLQIVDDDDNLRGVIAVSDVAESFMSAYDNRIVGKAGTKYGAIADTLEGKVVVGDPEKEFTRGKILVGAAHKDRMAEFIDEDDMVLLANHDENHIEALNHGAQCLVLCFGAKASDEVKKLAEEKGAAVIETPNDTFTVARLVSQSIPVSYFMRRDDLITFNIEDYTRDVEETMSKSRHHEYPVLDASNHYIGSISRKDLLNVKKNKVILVDHNEVSQAVDNISDAEIMEIYDHHKIGSVETINPVIFRNEPVGCSGTIMYKLYRENGLEPSKETAGLLMSAIISDTLMFRSPTCTPTDEEACRYFASICGEDIEPYAISMFKAGSDLAGKSAAEIFHMDYKQFPVGGITFGVGQVSAMTNDELSEIKSILEPTMKQECEGQGIQMVFFMLTNILDESTELMYYGEGSDAALALAFKSQPEGGSVMLPGVVSRKKQLIPPLMATLG
ncbi:MAG: putative manganese-dependent inorganic diphosphatase [Eubacteriaceae bacterium]|jgi:manganese-dependent inorganic pyrophosphatase|nr:putative manganese-dependent inorganic diphosphatase [Eubacteriaceae bacterium]